MNDFDSGAAQELALLYAEYAGPLQRYLWRLTGSPEQAEDLVQETFVKALRARSRCRSDDQVGAWLFRIARNTARDSFRREHRRSSTPLTELHIQTLAAETVESELDEAEPIQAALAQLPPAYRDLLLLHSYAGYSLAPASTMPPGHGHDDRRDRGRSPDRVRHPAEPRGDRRTLRSAGLVAGGDD